MTSDFLQRAWQSPVLTVAPGVYDPFTARLAQNMDFEAVYLGGNALGLHLGVGQPFVTLSETADAVRSITRRCSLPLIVDAGAGFGESTHAFMAMQTLASAGAAAVHIDDQIYPKRAHYHRGEVTLLSTAEVTRKLAAMDRARQASGALLIARTDAFRATGSLDQAIDRCHAYLAAGADALMILDLGIEDAPVVARQFPSIPVIWIGGIDEPVPGTGDLQNSGFASAVYPFDLIASAFEAMRTTLGEIKRTGLPPTRSAPGRSLVRSALEVVGLDELLSIEADEAATGTGGGGEPCSDTEDGQGA